ncbi:tetratricopeptide repeat protein [Brevibacillus dissolubilis]|uniref:tetratricopeptide repeat protein n=1 Tax=Brevibacillus dissolubilis TaxID=1844116 RepID=UPI001117917B|nr:tetratricopeptide repeat protein [Brevibacillus dissolubilis]
MKKLYIRLLVVLTICSFSIIGCSNAETGTANINGNSASDTVEEQFIQAVALLDQGKFTEAKPILESSMKKDPENGRYDYFLGNGYRRENDLENAQKHYLAAIEKSPEIIEAYNNAVGIYMYKEDLDKAFELADKGLAVQSDFLELVMKKGQILYLKTKYEETITTLTPIATNPNYFDAERIIGLSYLQLKKKKEAVEHLNNYLSLAPDGLKAKEEIKAFLQQNGLAK